MVEAELIKLLSNGGITAMFAFLLWWTLETSRKREERLLTRLDEQAKLLDKITVQLDHMAKEMERIARELDDR